MKAALMLVDHVGVLDAPLSALYLAFYQVCSAFSLSLTHSLLLSISFSRVCPSLLR